LAIEMTGGLAEKILVFLVHLMSIGLLDRGQLLDGLGDDAESFAQFRLGND
jgi:hypothetical protein